MNGIDSVVAGLRTLGLGDGEAEIYVALLEGPRTHAQLSRATGINRTTVYRVVEDLVRRGLVSRLTDDRGKFLVAADPAALEAELVAHEEQVRLQRAVFTDLMPRLRELRTGLGSAEFAVRTYEGVDGFKRMIWNELQAEGECLCIGLGTIEDLVPSRRWAERHRLKTVGAGYRVREIANPGTVPESFTDISAFTASHYERRDIPGSMVQISHMTSIYNDTVATYHRRGDHRIGVEVVSAAYARTMRQIGDHFWQLAG